MESNGVKDMNLFRQFLYGNRLAGNWGMSWVEWIHAGNPKARDFTRKVFRRRLARAPSPSAGGIGQAASGGVVRGAVRVPALAEHARGLFDIKSRTITESENRGKTRCARRRASGFGTQVQCFIEFSRSG